MITHVVCTDLQWGSQFPFRQSRSNAPSNSEIMVISDDNEIHEIPSLQQGKQPHKPRLAEVSIRTDRQNSDAHTKLCAGYHLSFPKGQQAHTSYPFALHTLMSLPWDYSTRKDAFVLMSHLCLDKAEVNGRCWACDNLGNNETLKKIISRYTNGIHEIRSWSTMALLGSLMLCTGRC